MVAISVGQDRKLCLMVGCAVLAGVIGCGGAAAPPPTAERSAPAGKPAPAAAAASTPTPAATAAAPASAGGRKFVGDIPYDVFFDDPLGVVADSTQVAAPAMVETKAPTGDATKPSEAAPAAAAGGASDWSVYLTGDDIQGEIKRCRNHLNTTLQTLGTYKDGVKEIAVDGAVISALARMLSETPDDATWKKNAGLVEEYGLQIWQAASGANALGKEPYEQVQAANERLVAVLSGNVPADAPTLPADRTFQEIAHRKGLMKRIERASEYLRANINTEGKLKSEQETILHEAALIAAFGKACALPAYESSDEEDYQTYAKDLIGGAVEAHEAAKSGAFDKFQGGINRIQKACTDCHANYATGG